MNQLNKTMMLLFLMSHSLASYLLDTYRLVYNNDAQNGANFPSDNNTPSLVNNTSTSGITINGIQYISISNLNVNYCHSYDFTNKGSLVDRGANGRLCGTDVHIIEKTGRSVNMQGIDNHQIDDVPIVINGAIVHIQCGPIIVILHQYASTGHGKTTHSSG